MLKTLLIDTDRQACETIQSVIRQYCSGVEFFGMADQLGRCFRENTQQPNLIFWGDPDTYSLSSHLSGNEQEEVLNVLLLKVPLPGGGYTDQSRLESVDGFLYKPIKVPELLIMLSHASGLVELRKGFRKQQGLLNQLLNRSSNQEMVGIPTAEGMEFYKASEILRCEGRQKYTLILTTRQQEVTSSYNIGEFCKLLSPHGFFAPHRSHLINLRHITKLTNENLIVLRDGTHVPLSRRRKSEFMRHFRPEGCFL